MTQTYTTGQTALDQIKAKYCRPDDPFCDPYKSITLLVARPKVGKSTFIGSSKKIIRIDTDRAGTTVGGVGMSIPYRDHSPITFDWVVERIDELIALKKKGALEDVTTIAIDTLPALVALAVEQLEIDERKAFEDQDGRRAWNIVYGKIMKLIFDVKNSGLGLILVIHLVEKKKPMGLDAAVTKEDINVADGLWARIHAIIDIALWLDRTDSPEIVEEPLPNGATKKIRTGRFISKWVLRFRTGTDSELFKILGGRFKKTPPDFIELPNVSGSAVNNNFELYAKTVESLNS